MSMIKKYLKKNIYCQKKDRQLLMICDNGISKKNSLLDNTPNQPTKFRIKSWAKINDDTRV